MRTIDQYCLEVAENTSVNAIDDGGPVNKRIQTKY